MSLVTEHPILPQYAGPNVRGIVPALLGPAGAARPSWMPEVLADCRQIVLLIVDGLGWEQLQERLHLAPTMSSLGGRSITTVAPSTTATALTSISTGLTPGEHGLVGYRIDMSGDILNVLRWSTGSGDARRQIEPAATQPFRPFLGESVPVVSRIELEGSAFTEAHLRGTRGMGWRTASGLPVTVRQLLEAGERFVYAYYDGVDKVAHEFGLGREYDAEVCAADRVSEAIMGLLPRDAALVVTSDHGQVDVGENVVALATDVIDRVTMLSGEGRFRWLHARPGQSDALAAAARRCHGDQAWVRTLAEATSEGWFGGDLTPDSISRLGDVVIAARDAVAFLDPGDTGEVHLRSRHGSLTSAEMLVPLLAARA